MAYTVLFDVDNHDAELMPQMTAQVAFVIARIDGAHAVPLAALTATANGDAHTARVLNARGEIEARALRVGVRSRHQAQVLDGLREGERVVIGESTSEAGLRWLQW